VKDGIIQGKENAIGDLESRLKQLLDDLLKFENIENDNKRIVSELEARQKENEEWKNKYLNLETVE
jgi:hypothetical protein